MTHEHTPDRPPTGDGAWVHCGECGRRITLKDGKWEVVWMGGTQTGDRPREVPSGDATTQES